MADLVGKRIGFCLTGSFCTFDKVLPQIRKLVDEGAQVVPIFSQMVYNNDTRFYTAKEIIDTVEQITGQHPLHTIQQVEPIGPKGLLDLVVIAPCTGNTLAKMAAGIVDTTVTMTAKSQLRNGRPVVIGISTNDGLSGNAKNVGTMLNIKNVYFIPYGQDDWQGKPTSVVADMEELVPTIREAFEGRQRQPLIVNLQKK